MMRWNEGVLIGLGSALTIVLIGAVGLDPFFEGAVKAATIAVAPLTLGLVWLTRVLADETRKTRLQGKEPHIVVTIEPNKYLGFFDLVIENVGAGTAFHIVTKFNPDIIVEDQRGPVRISDCGILSIPVLKPGQRITSFLGHFRDFKIRVSAVSCECLDSDGEKHLSANVVDVSVFEDMGQLGEDDLRKLADNVEKLRGTFERIASGNARIQVDTHDDEDRTRERRRVEEWHREIKARRERGEA